MKIKTIVASALIFLTSATSFATCRSDLVKLGFLSARGEPTAFQNVVESYVGLLGQYQNLDSDDPTGFILKNEVLKKDADLEKLLADAYVTPDTREKIKIYVREKIARDSKKLKQSAADAIKKENTAREEEIEGLKNQIVSHPTRPFKWPGSRQQLVLGPENIMISVGGGALVFYDLKTAKEIKVLSFDHGFQHDPPPMTGAFYSDTTGELYVLENKSLFALNVRGFLKTIGHTVELEPSDPLFRYFRGLSFKPEPFTAFQFSGDGRVLVNYSGNLFGSGEDEQKPIIVIPNVPQDSPAIYIAPKVRVFSVNLDPDGKFLAYSTLDESVVMDIATNSRIPEFEKIKPKSSLVFSNDGKFLAAFDGSGKGEVWDVGKKKRIRILKNTPGLVRPDNRIPQIAWSKDGALIAVAYEGEPEVRIYNDYNSVPSQLLDRNKNKPNFRMSLDNWMSLKFSTDNTFLFGSLEAGQLIWKKGVLP